MPIEGINCGKLTSGIVGFDCENPPIGGINPNVVLINMDDINYNVTTITNGVLTQLALKDGKKGFSAVTRENGVDASVTFNKGTYVNSWGHSFTFRLFDNSPAAKNFVHGLEKSRIVAIIQNKYIKLNPTSPETKGETVYEVYGFYSGLVLTEGTRDPKDAETAGAYVLTVASDENAKEPTVPVTLFSVDLTTTETIINEILNPI